MLHAALSGLVPPPSPPPSLQPGAESNQTEKPWPSPPPPCPLPLSSTTPNGSNGRGRSAGGGGFGNYQWDEAFLGLLSAAVWTLPAVRCSLVAANAEAEEDGATPPGAARTAVRTDITGGPAGVAAAVVAVLRRLYHPRPSVRRLASSVAVRLAFDSPSFFSALDCCGDVVRGGSVSLSQDGIGNDDCSGGEGGGGMVRLGDGFAVPRMVLDAYPRLMELDGSGDGGGGGGDVNGRGGDERVGLRATAVYQHGEQGQNGNRSDVDDPVGSLRIGHAASALAFEHLVASEWALLLQNLSSNDAQSQEEQEGGQPPQDARAREPRHCSVLAPELAAAIQRAGRRSEFAAAMLEARAAMLSGSG